MDSRYLQRCADKGHRSLAHASVHGKPIREKGLFGYVDTPVRDADWSVEYSVGLIPVGDIRIDYLRDPALISQIEESEVPLMSEAAKYAAPETPGLETVIESPGYTVPGDF